MTGAGGPADGRTAGRELPASAHPASPLAALPVTLVGSFPDPKHPLDPPLPEVALVGRSNVGKSSLINALLARPGLARVSATPGKTQLLNVYRLPGQYLIDLPGYGFAQAPKAQRAAYRQLLRAVLAKRQTLAGLVWLLDIRHDPSAEDLETLEMLERTQRPVLAVFTKADKLSRQQQLQRTRALAASLGLAHDQVLVTSSQSGLGLAELGASILAVEPLPQAEPDAP
ncbi:MAG: ribosome biogenesis GTP-binding protein YihA/YsxC [Gemmatimonadales bacterium]|nr:ribosome biogenesis GTP-binding protein YihA/YsxC [Gemmatimonadales bacterium]